MYDCKVEHKNWTDYRDKKIVIHVCEAIVLLVGDGLNNLLVYLLLEGSDRFVFVIEEFFQVRIISSLPFGRP